MDASGFQRDAANGGGHRSQRGLSPWCIASRQILLHFGARTSTLVLNLGRPR